MWEIEVRTSDYRSVPKLMQITLYHETGKKSPRKILRNVARFFDDIWVAASLFESGNRRKGDLEATFLDHFLSTFSTLNNLHLVANVPNQAVI